MLTPLKWGIVTCLSRWTLKCGGSFNRGPNLDHYGGGPRNNLGYESKCWAGFNSQVDKLMNHIGATK
jgi:hypothetical protein